ncbi:hypothetical protein BofuT4_P144930.1 [Botrytis cinerea T4]|uniref:Uncharacterized protein n=1 Tax=Botryotinia fuckeliana (strain T4) TaxID=999810 RepID=G2YYI7_BOTF4|nr:hypothetical protein BofuT4_P144930.1 [Botrytis cinerea T4]
MCIQILTSNPAVSIWRSNTISPETFIEFQTFEKTRLPGDKTIAVNGSVTDEKGLIGDLILAENGRPCRRKQCSGSFHPQNQMRYIPECIVSSLRPHSPATIVNPGAFLE